MIKPAISPGNRDRSDPREESMTNQGARFFKERIVAPEGFNRWLVPPAALAVHLCISQAYAFSVFNEPLTRIVGITAPAPEDWKLTTVGWIFSLANFIPGLATAAFAGKWVDRWDPGSRCSSPPVALVVAS